MGIRPTVGSGQSVTGSQATTMRCIIFWTVVMGVTGGQELLMARNHGNQNAAEIRFDPRALSWMEFSKPEPGSNHPLQQKHQQWFQPPMPVNSNTPRRTAEQQWNPHGQNWPGYYDHSQRHLPLQSNHPDRNVAHQYPYRPMQPVDEMQRWPKQQQLIPPARDAPRDSISSQQWHRELPQPPREPIHHPGAESAYSTETSDILSDVRSDEIFEEEFYDSSELFEEEEVELDSTSDEHSAKIKAEEEMLIREKDEEDATMEILSAFTSSLSNLPRRNEQSGADKEQVDVKTPPASIQQSPTWKHLYPQLLRPATPPGKRVIVTEEYPSSKPRASDNHRVSYGLTAASVYARIQPSLRHRNGTGGLRQRVVPRPYKRRPITVKSTTSMPVDKQREPHVQDVEDVEDVEDEEEEEEEEEEFDMITEETENENDPLVEDMEEEEVIPMATVLKEVQQDNEPDIEALSEPDQLSSKEDIQINMAGSPTEVIEDEDEEEPGNGKTQPAIENETLKPKASSPPAADGPGDIKSLLRSAGPLSLSEILQQKGMSLADLLKGGAQIAPVIGVTTSSPTAPDAASPKNPLKVEHTATSMTTPIISTHPTTAKTMVTNAPIRTGEMPTVKTISFRELLAAKNVTLQEIIHPDMTVIGTEKPSANNGVRGTLKPGVKLPIPFAPGRGKGLKGLVASTAPPSEEFLAESINSKSTTTPQPRRPMNSKSVSELIPLIFGGGRPLDEDTDDTTTTSTTTTRTSRQMVIHSKRPYVAGANVGEYGSHLGRSFEEEDDEDGSRSKSSNNLVGSYGMQRPIATSRLTPPPPRKQRPVLNFNYNALSEEEDEDEMATPTTPTPILTHFNEDELIENDPYFDLPESVRNAIIVSSTIGGFCLAVFLVILLVFRIRQKTRIRLRHPAALLGLGGMTDMTASNGSDSSGITTPTSNVASKSGYAKLPRRSSSLWGTLRRSVRQMEVHYS